MKSLIVEEVKSFRKKVRTPVGVQQQQQAEKQRQAEEIAAAQIQDKEAKERWVYHIRSLTLN